MDERQSVSTVFWFRIGMITYASLYKTFATFPHVAETSHFDCIVFISFRWLVFFPSTLCVCTTLCFPLSSTASLCVMFTSGTSILTTNYSIFIINKYHGPLKQFYSVPIRESSRAVPSIYGRDWLLLLPSHEEERPTICAVFLTFTLLVMMYARSRGFRQLPEMRYNYAKKQNKIQ